MSDKRTYLTVPPSTSPIVDNMLDGLNGWAIKADGAWTVYAVPADMVDRVVKLGGMPYSQDVEEGK